MLKQLKRFVSVAYFVWHVLGRDVFQGSQYPQCHVNICPMKHVVALLPSSYYLAIYFIHSFDLAVERYCCVSLSGQSPAVNHPPGLARPDTDRPRAQTRGFPFDAYTSNEHHHIMESSAAPLHDDLGSNGVLSDDHAADDVDSAPIPPENDVAGPLAETEDGDKSPPDDDADPEGDDLFGDGTETAPADEAVLVDYNDL